MPDVRRNDAERALIAGAYYFQIVFAIGFVLGVLRGFMVAPAIGEFSAVAIELPILLAASWLVARRLIGRYKVPAQLQERLMMGGFAFTLLVLVEAALSIFGFGRTLAQHIAHYREPAGLLGLAGQIAFALVPALQLARK